MKTEILIERQKELATLLIVYREICVKKNPILGWRETSFAQWTKGIISYLLGKRPFLIRKFVKECIKYHKNEKMKKFFNIEDEFLEEEFFLGKRRWLETISEKVSEVYSCLMLTSLNVFYDETIEKEVKEVIEDIMCAVATEGITIIMKKNILEIFKEIYEKETEEKYVLWKIRKIKEKEEEIKEAKSI